MQRTYNGISDVPLAITAALVCEQVEIGYSLISATLPNLKAFIQSFHTEMMMNVAHKLNRPNGPNSDESSGSVHHPPTSSSAQITEEQRIVSSRGTASVPPNSSSMKSSPRTPRGKAPSFMANS
jgi:hypothetical protein